MSKINKTLENYLALENIITHDSKLDLIKLIQDELRIRRRTFGMHKREIAALSGAAIHDHRERLDGPWTARAGAKRNIEEQIYLRKKQEIEKHKKELRFESDLELQELEERHLGEIEKLREQQFAEIIALKQRHLKEENLQITVHIKQITELNMLQQAKIQSQKLRNHQVHKQERLDFRHSEHIIWGNYRLQLLPIKELHLKARQELITEQLKAQIALTNKQLKAINALETKHQIELQTLKHEVSHKQYIDILLHKKEQQQEELNELKYAQFEAREELQCQQENARKDLVKQQRVELAEQTAPENNAARLRKEKQHIVLEKIRREQQHTMQQLSVEHRASKKDLQKQQKNEAKSLQEDQDLEMQAIDFKHKQQKIELSTRQTEEKESYKAKNNGIKSKDKTTNQDAMLLTRTNNTNQLSYTINRGMMFDSSTKKKPQLLTEDEETKKTLSL